MTPGTFGDLFGRAPDASAEAPGRVNLIGEHTDYNGGYVLPVAIPQRTRVEAARRDDRMVRLSSAQFGDGRIAEYSLGDERRTGTWVDYAQAMTQELSRCGAIGGVDARIDSTVPGGSGLSSSAALLVALGRVLRMLFAVPIGDVELALAARRAENEFVGAPVGIMDQMACSLADTEHALFIDTRTLQVERIRLPPGAALVVIDSGIRHRHAGGAYATRRRECAESARLVGVAELRDVDEAGVARLARLPPPLDRRARHVVTENGRVLAAAAALRAGDLVRAGELFYASHDSMRDDFEVSVPAIDAMVDLARRVDGIYGARMTGGGFGGSVVALADVSSAGRAAAAIATAYARATGQSPTVLVPQET